MDDEIKGLIERQGQVARENTGRIEASRKLYDAVANFKRADRVPFNISLNPVWSDWYPRKYGITVRQMLKDARLHAVTQLRSGIDKFLEFDDDGSPYSGVAVCLGVVTEPSVVGCRIVWPENDWPWVDLSHGSPLDTPEKIDDYSAPDVETAGLIPQMLGMYNDMRKLVGDEMGVGFADGEGPIQLACYARGIRQIIRDMYEQPDLAHKLIKKMVDTWLRIREFYIGNFGHAMSYFTENPLSYFSRKQYDEFIFPYHRDIIESFGGSWGYNCQGILDHLVDKIAELPNFGNINLTTDCNIRKCREVFGRKKAFINFLMELPKMCTYSDEHLASECRRIVGEITPEGGSSIGSMIVDHTTDERKLQVAIDMVKNYGGKPRI